MHILKLLDFFKEATRYVAPGVEVIDPETGLERPAVGYHKRIVVISLFFGLLGAAAGVAFVIATLSNPQPDPNKDKAYLAPLLFGAGGLLFGVAIACLFAPREFLTGPAGEKWMTLIGTQNVLVARIVCLILGLIVVAPFVGVGLLIAFDK